MDRIQDIYHGQQYVKLWLYLTVGPLLHNKTVEIIEIRIRSEKPRAVKQ